jgi:ankyrin repeat protein
MSYSALWPSIHEAVQDISSGGSDASSVCAASGSPPESREAINKVESWISDVDEVPTEDPNENAGEGDSDSEDAERYLQTVFHIAVDNEYLDLIQLLLSVGVDVNSRRWDRSQTTALQAAVKGGNLNIIQLLLENGADVNATGIFEQTVLHVATEG